MLISIIWLIEEASWHRYSLFTVAIGLDRAMKLMAIDNAARNGACRKHLSSNAKMKYSVTLSGDGESGSASCGGDIYISQAAYYYIIISRRDFIECARRNATVCTRCAACVIVSGVGSISFCYSWNNTSLLLYGHACKCRREIYSGSQ